LDETDFAISAASPFRLDLTAWALRARVKSSRHSMNGTPVPDFRRRLSFACKLLRLPAGG